MRYESQLAETTLLRGHEGDPIDAYLARPLGAGPYPGIVIEFRTYENAGHAFFAVDRPQYRAHAAVDGGKKVFACFDKYLR